MLVAILHNRDHDVLEDDPGREARKDVIEVALALADALSRHQLSAEPVAVGVDPLPAFEWLSRLRPDVVVNLCESIAADSRGEMAVPCMLELLGVPYTGSHALALGLALHKNKAKEILLARKVPTPAFCVVESVAQLVEVDLPFPLIVKPAREDGSMCIDFDSVVYDRAALGRAVTHVLRACRQPALVEQYVDGREIYVPLLGNKPPRALPLSEIRFGPAFEGRPRIVSYRAKWDESSPEWADSPSQRCELDRPTETRIVETALRAFEALDCRDYGRVDVRLSADGKPYVIDVNPNCDLHPSAGFARSAAAAGIGYSDLALHLVEIALERSHARDPSNRAAGQRAARRAFGPNRNVLAARGGLRPRAHRPRAQAEQP